MEFLLKHKVVTVLLISLLALTGCSSSLVLGKLYDGFGSSTAKRFKSYASFNEAQVKQIDALAASYHSWHRTTQLERYSAFLRSIVSDVEATEELSISAAESWWGRVRGFSDDMRTCNPLNVSSELLASLSDRQVSQVAANMRKELNREEDEYRAETPDERLERRVSEISKWGKRSGFSFNDAQTVALRKTLNNQISLGAQRFELRRIWMEEFILLLSRRNESGFDNKVTRHIASVWRITQTAFPNQWGANENLWKVFIKDFINLQSQEQRRRMIGKMTSVADTLNKLASKNVSAAAVCHIQ